MRECCFYIWLGGPGSCSDLRCLRRLPLLLLRFPATKSLTSVCAGSWHPVQMGHTLSHSKSLTVGKILPLVVVSKSSSSSMNASRTRIWPQFPTLVFLGCMCQVRTYDGTCVCVFACIYIYIMCVCVFVFVCLSLCLCAVPFSLWRTCF